MVRSIILFMNDNFKRFCCAEFYQYYVQLYIFFVIISIITCRCKIFDIYLNEINLEQNAIYGKFLFLHSATYTQTEDIMFELWSNVG